MSFCQSSLLSSLSAALDKCTGCMYVLLKHFSIVMSVASVYDVRLMCFLSRSSHRRPALFMCSWATDWLSSASWKASVASCSPCRTGAKAGACCWRVAGGVTELCRGQGLHSERLQSFAHLLHVHLVLSPASFREWDVCSHMCSLVEACASNVEIGSSGQYFKCHGTLGLARLLLGVAELALGCLYDHREPAAPLGSLHVAGSGWSGHGMRGRRPGGFVHCGGCGVCSCLRWAAASAKEAPVSSCRSEESDEPFGGRAWQRAPGGHRHLHDLPDPVSSDQLQQCCHLCHFVGASRSTHFLHWFQRPFVGQYFLLVQKGAPGRWRRSCKGCGNFRQAPEEVCSESNCFVWYSLVLRSHGTFGS